MVSAIPIYRRLSWGPPRAKIEDFQFKERERTHNATDNTRRCLSVENIQEMTLLKTPYICRKMFLAHNLNSIPVSLIGRFTLFWQRD